MEENIIKQFYLNYLQEVFDVDKVDTSKLSYIIKTTEKNNWFINPQTGIKVNYKNIHSYSEGYAIVDNGVKKNFINEKGELLSEEWFDEATDFHNGYALVTRRGVSNLIDIKGNFLFKEWTELNSIYSKFYSNGVAIIKPSEGNPSVVDKEGNKIFKNIVEIIFSFEGKYAVALKKSYNPLKRNSLLSKDYDYHYHIIDCEGNDLKTEYSYLRQLDENIFVAQDKHGDRKFIVNAQGVKIGKENFDSLPYNKFKNGYLIVCKYGKENLMDKNGELLYEKWYQEISYPYNGICRIRENGRYNYIDKDGNLLSSKWFDYARDFLDDCGVVVIDNKYYVVDINGKLSENCYDSISEFHNGYSIVKNQEKYNVIDKEGNLISDQWYPYSSNQFQENMLRLVRNEQGLCNYVALDGTPLLPEWKSNLTNISNGLFGSYENNKLTIYNIEGEIITTLDNIDEISIGHLSFRAVEESPKKEIIQSRKKWFHYNYEVNGRKYLLDYEPVIDYGDIIICANAEKYFIFQKATLNTYSLGPKGEITLENNYIVVGNKKYFISNTDLIDISELSFTRKIEKKPGVNRVLTLDEFKQMCNQPDYREKIQAEMDKLKTSIAEKKKAELIEEANKKIETERQALDEKRENLRKSLSNLSEILAECSKYITEIEMLSKSNSSNKINVPEELLLISVNDHFELNPIFLVPGILKYIDLSLISFKDVKVNGLDLSFTNAKINPQEVYNKDMSNGKYCGLDFNLRSFNGVNITNSDFTEAIVDFASDFDNKNKGL